MSTVFTWYGHAALGLDVDGTRILVDPFLTGNPVASVSPEAVQPQYILLSHGHSDHLGDTIAIARRTGATVISNFELIEWLAKQGVQGHPQHLGGGFTYPFGYVKLTLALHGSALPDGSYGGNPCGFLISTNSGLKVYFACDTGLFGDMSLIGEEGIDLAVLPIGDNFTMGPSDALRAVKLIKPRHVIPVHYDTFGLIKQDANAWAAQVKATTATEPHVLKPGESFELS
jgi:L-ascorbate metabolism protein UlaG (beta-lactamase superfamily)